MKALFLPTMLAALLLCGCGVPSHDTVRADFLREHPGFEVTDLFPGEGDSDAVYFHIRHKKPGDSKQYEVVWLYVSDGDKPWKVVFKSDRQ
jgi:hypothetical protein